MADSLTAGQRQTLAARQTFSRQFITAEAKSAHYRALGQKSAEGRFVLPAEDARALAEANASLQRLTEIVGRIAQRVEQRATEEAATEAA